MEDTLRHAFVPKRNVRHSLHRTPKEDAEWADTLDWQTHDCAVYLLFECLFERLDSDYRRLGLRLDQLSGRVELIANARRAVSWYQQADLKYRTVGIYDYLHRDLEQFLSKRARLALDKRHKLAVDLMPEGHVVS